MARMSGLKLIRDHSVPDEAAFVWILLRLGNGTVGKCGQRGRVPCTLLRPAKALLFHLIRTSHGCVFALRRSPVPLYEMFNYQAKGAGIDSFAGKLSSRLRNAYLEYAMHLVVDHGWRVGSTPVCLSLCTSVEYGRDEILHHTHLLQDMLSRNALNAVDTVPPLFLLGVDRAEMHGKTVR